MRSVLSSRLRRRRSGRSWREGITGNRRARVGSIDRTSGPVLRGRWRASRLHRIQHEVDGLDDRWTNQERPPPRTHHRRLATMPPRRRPPSTAPRRPRGTSRFGPGSPFRSRPRARPGNRLRRRRRSCRRLPLVSSSPPIQHRRRRSCCGRRGQRSLRWVSRSPWRERTPTRLPAPGGRPPVRGSGSRTVVPRWTAIRLPGWSRSTRKARFMSS
mmetsp:Transcript_15226/g.35282  ORF Transcript_15226/g.35282 Transcript_15226/m.35282 type:complete len:214 (-) Transcript_15226:345-986(-)